MHISRRENCFKKSEKDILKNKGTRRERVKWARLEEIKGPGKNSVF